MTMLNQVFVLYKQSLICLISLLCLFIYCDDNDCWIHFDAKDHFDVMEQIDDRYAEVRENFQNTMGGNKFDKDMLDVMLQNRGIAERALHKAEGDKNMIPAGINLGGHCMMRIPNSLLFFHRMKLRNNTRFRVVSLESNLTTLDLKANLLLNDLHLMGSYDVTETKEDNSLLLYYPSYGEIEFLLKNVSYKVEGRYRLLNKRLNLELVTSEILMDDILMMYQNKSSANYVTNKLNKIYMKTKNIESFSDRLKVDLDKWIKDYLNDYLMYFVVTEDSEFEKYSQEKTAALNKYADKIIDTIKDRINDIQANAVQLASFTIKTINGAEIRLRDGALRGLDSIYRRSTTTGTLDGYIRKVDTIVGFSNLKMQYRYDTKPQVGFPPVTGVLTLIADDLTAHMGLMLLKDSETGDLTFKFLETTKPESLTVEGSANRMISNFKYVLERHVIGIMMNSLVHNINMLGTLDKCIPILAAFKDPTDTGADDDYKIEKKNKLNVNTNELTEDNTNENDDTHESPVVLETVSPGQESQPQSQEGPPVRGETDEAPEQDYKQQAKKGDIVKETAENTLNSGDRDNNINTQKPSTNLLAGQEDEKDIDRKKKLKYHRRYPKFKIHKERNKTFKHNTKH